MIDLTVHVHHDLPAGATVGSLVVGLLVSTGLGTAAEAVPLVLVPAVDDGLSSFLRLKSALSLSILYAVGYEEAFVVELVEGEFCAGGEWKG